MQRILSSNLYEMGFTSHDAFASHDTGDGTNKTASPITGDIRSRVSYYEIYIGDMCL